MTIEMKQQSTSPSHHRGPKVILHYWGRRGGGSDVTLFLAQHLRRADELIDVTLSLSNKNDDMATFEATGLPIIAMDRPSLSTLWQDVWRLPGRFKDHVNSLASLKPDVVIMTMNAPFAWPFIRLLQRREIKVFYIAHDAEPHPGDYAITWQRLSQDLLIKSADRVVALSNSVAKRIVERIPASSEKITIVPLEAIYPTEHTRLCRRQPSNEPVRLLFYGRLLPYKGLDLLATALEPFRDNLNWRLTVAGSGPLETEVEKAFVDWPQVDLRFGWVSHDETAELFSAHDLLLCPYVEASQSGVVAQAMSWAMPSLVMPRGALPEQIGFGVAGIVAERADADGFSQALRSVLGRPDLLTGLSQGAADLLAERQADQGWVRLVEVAS
jgi:glycosyltransferase involved in cell wall biosynthesis